MQQNVTETMWICRYISKFLCLSGFVWSVEFAIYNIMFYHRHSMLLWLILLDKHK